MSPHLEQIESSRVAGFLGRLQIKRSYWLHEKWSNLWDTRLFDRVN